MRVGLGCDEQIDDLLLSLSLYFLATESKDTTQVGITESLSSARDTLRWATFWVHVQSVGGCAKT